MNVITDWKNLRRLYDEINCRCKLNIFQGARVKSLCQMFAASFYGITENKKSANEHLPQTYAIFLTILPQNDKIQLYLCFEEKNYILTSGGGYLR